MRILVTGATGFLGGHILKQLLKTSHIPVGLARNENPELKKLQIEQRLVDIQNKNKLRAALKDIDGIIHTAAIAGVWGDPNQFYQINFIGTKNLVDLCLEMGIQYFVYTSTPSVVSRDHDIINGDESLTYPDHYYTEYARTKAMAERYVLSQASHKFKALALRPHLIWGRGDRHILPTLIDRAKKGRLRIVGSGENLVSVVHVFNATHAHLLALAKLIKDDHQVIGKAFFISDENEVKLWPFINQMLAKHNLGPITKKISYRSAYRLGALFEFIFKTFKIYQHIPPMTRFTAMQLAHSHYFKNDLARDLLDYEPIISQTQGLNEL
jgi:nucleoside-diphosphate-sugar epimerase